MASSGSGSGPRGCCVTPFSSGMCPDICPRGYPVHYHALRLCSCLILSDYLAVPSNPIRYPLFLVLTRSSHPSSFLNSHLPHLFSLLICPTSSPRSFRVVHYKLRYGRFALPCWRLGCGYVYVFLISFIPDRRHESNHFIG